MFRNVVGKAANTFKSLGTALWGMGKKFVNRDKKVKGSNELPENYDSGVDDFAKPDMGVNVTKEYSYSYGGKEVDIGEDFVGIDGYEDYVREYEDDYEEEDSGEGDFWDEEVRITGEEEGDYKEEIENLGRRTPEFEEVIQYYGQLSELGKKDKTARELIKLRDQIHQSLNLSGIGQIPTFLNTKEDIIEKTIKIVKVNLSEEDVREEVILEIDRYQVIFKEFVSIVEKGDAFTLNDWELVVKYIDFVKKVSNVPEMMLILTKISLPEVVEVLHEGYIPYQLDNTAVKSLGIMVQGYLEGIDKGDDFYLSIVKAYEVYKKNLGMYTKLRNRGRLVDINKILGLYYGKIDKIAVNEGAPVDVFMGLIDPHDITYSYLGFLYGNAKQSEAMSNFVMRLMEERPKVVEMLMEDGYVLGDNPKGISMYFTGRIVMYVDTGKGKYSILFNKPPSDIAVKDIKTIADKFTKSWGEEKKKKPIKKKVQSSKVVGSSYDFEKAMKLFSKDKK